MVTSVGAVVRLAAVSPFNNPTKATVNVGTVVLCRIVRLSGRIDNGAAETLRVPVTKEIA